MGFGKIFLVFFFVINELIFFGKESKFEDKIYVFYVLFFCVLNNDIKRNLEGLLVEIKEVVKEFGYELFEIRVGIRMSDILSYEKSKMVKKLFYILIIILESFVIVLNVFKFSERLKMVKYVIIDEVYVLVENKRGFYFVLSIERF